MFEGKRGKLPVRESEAGPSGMAREDDGRPRDSARESFSSETETLDDDQLDKQVQEAIEPLKVFQPEEPLNSLHMLHVSCRRVDSSGAHLLLRRLLPARRLRPFAPTK